MPLHPRVVAYAQAIDIRGVPYFFRVPHLHGSPCKPVHAQQVDNGPAPPWRSNLKMFWLRVPLLLLVCCTTRSCWAQKNASLTSITVLPCSGSHTQDVSLYSSDIYTVIANLSLCPDLETNGTVVRTLPCR